METEEKVCHISATVFLCTDEVACRQQDLKPTSNGLDDQETSKDCSAWENYGWSCSVSLVPWLALQRVQEDVIPVCDGLVFRNQILAPTYLALQALVVAFP
jgi:hypothetical protein